jgi:acyl carrier protein phosphodiesterase
LSKEARSRLAELRVVSEEAEAGDRNARKRLRRLVRSSSPQVMAEASDFVGRAEWMLANTISAGEPLMREAIQERMRQMRSEIAGESPTPLEVMLTERVVAGWLLVEVLEGLISAQYHRHTDKTARVPPGYIAQMSRILESATRRYLAAIRELARVRRVQAGMPVRVNTLNVLAG